MRLLTLVAALAILVAGPAAADSYPNRPVKIICVYPAGGGLDVVLRTMGRKLSDIWKTPVIIENVAGGGTTIGTAAVAKATADGYTLLATDISFAISAHQHQRLPYDPVKDLAPVSLFAIASHGLVVNSSVPIHSVKELIAYSRNNPGKMLYATPGPGSIDHLAWALLNKEAKGNITAVPYKGSAASLIDVVAGRVQIYSGATGTLLKYVNSGQLRPLAVFETDRVDALQSVPTISETGFPDITMNAWYGLMAPAGTPETIINQINSALQDVLKDKDVRNNMAALADAPVFGKGPAEVAAVVRADLRKWGEAVALSEQK